MEASMGYSDFVRTHGRALLRFAVVLTGSTDAGEDLAQDALLRACKQWSRVSRAENPYAYVRRLLVNVHLDQRRLASVSTVSLELVGGAAALETAKTGAVDLALTLGPALKTLPVRQRTALVLRFYADLDFRQVALEMGISESSARSAATRALQTLRAQLTLADQKDEAHDR